MKASTAFTKELKQQHAQCLEAMTKSIFTTKFILALLTEKFPFISEPELLAFIIRKYKVVNEGNSTTIIDLAGMFEMHRHTLAKLLSDNIVIKQAFELDLDVLNKPEKYCQKDDGEN